MKCMATFVNFIWNVEWKKDKYFAKTREAVLTQGKGGICGKVLSNTDLPRVVLLDALLCELPNHSLITALTFSAFSGTHQKF